MEKLGVPALIINSDTVASEDLWIKARAGIAMLILGPEQLIKKEFRTLLAFQPFYDRVCALGVDEIHLLIYWGLAFHKSFLQIGYMWARLRRGIPVIGLTATLLADLKVENAIFSLLGVNRGEFHLIRRSNARMTSRSCSAHSTRGSRGNYSPRSRGCSAPPIKIDLWQHRPTRLLAQVLFKLPCLHRL